MVDPQSLHRALADCKLLARLILEKYSITEIIEYANKPWTYLRALVPAPWTDKEVGKNWARQNGYSWQVCKGTDGPTWDKAWVKRVKDYAPEVTPYEIVVLEIK